MNSVEESISNYLQSLSSDKHKALEELYQLVRGVSSDSKLWFLDGKNEAGKVVSNPNIGFGTCSISAGKSGAREFYKVGISATSTGISVYVFDLPSKTFLQDRYGQGLGKAKITGYCISFKKLSDVNSEVLKNLIGDCLSKT